MKKLSIYYKKEHTTTLMLHVHVPPPPQPPIHPDTYPCFYPFLCLKRVNIPQCDYIHTTLVRHFLGSNILWVFLNTNI